MNRVMSWTGRGIFTAYASCVVWADDKIGGDP